MQKNSRANIFKGVAILGIVLLLWQIIRMIFIAPDISTIFVSREWDSELIISIVGFVLLMGGAYFSKKVEVKKQ